MSKVWKLMKFEFKLLFASGSIFFIFFFPLMFILIEGAIVGDQKDSVLGGIKTMDSLVPGIIIMGMATTSINTLANAIVGTRESKILKRISVTPIKTYHYIITYILFYSIVTYVSAIIIFIFAKLTFGVQNPQNLLQLHVLYFLGVITMMLFGFLVAGNTKNTRALTGKSMLVFQPMIFLGGAALPFAFLPASLKTIAQFVPLTYISEPFKNIWNGNDLSLYTHELLVLLGFIIALGLIVVSRFKLNEGK